LENSWIFALFGAEVIATVCAAEIRNLRWATIAIGIQSLILVGIINSFAYLSGNHSLYLWALTAFVIKVLLIPWLLWTYGKKMPVSEVKPIINLPVSLTIIAIILVGTYLCTTAYLYPHFVNMVPSIYQGIAQTAGINLSVGLAIFILGIYILLSRRDIVKVVIGLVALENGAHLVLVSLAPTLAETAEIGIACNLIIASWLLLYLSSKIYESWKTKDSTTLSELKR
jgi:hydrogenase-4 component E